MKHIIQFLITKEDGYYTAQGVGFPVITQAKTLDELSQNIREATDLALSEDDTFGYGSRPSVLMSMEIAPEYA
jgi:predicted RNase H-like HicB family nuclease